MKKLLLLLTITLSLSCCNNDDDQPVNPMDQLPPETQTGEQTFGCMINGEAFVSLSFGSNSPSAFYQFVDGAYTLSISASKGGGNDLKSVLLGALDVPNITETNYLIRSEQSGNFVGKYLIGWGIIDVGISSDDNPGTLTIKNFDPENFIISGTFEFTVLDNDGNEIEITNGRFDMNYTN